MSKFRYVEDSPFLNLENITRFSNRRLMTTDYDSSHSIRIQLYLLETYKNVGEVFDLKEACYKALIHDLDEIGCSDVSRIFKYHDQEIYRNIVRVSNEMLREYEIPEDIIEDIHSSKDSSVEGNLVRFFDVFDAYRTLNNETMISHSSQLCSDAQWSLDLMKSLLDNFEESPLREYLEFIYFESRERKASV